MQVEIRDFSGLLSNSIAYINNSKDGVLRPLPVDEILHRAHKALGYEGYDLIFHNCEHFAHWCRSVLSSLDPC
jgi:hypothetical protein